MTTTWYVPGRPMVRALSFWRPWGANIVHAGKRVENRPWTTRHRGLFVIHAGKKWDDLGLLFADLFGPDDLDMPGDQGDYPTGLIAVADLVDICERSVGARELRCDCGPWAAAGQYHWRLDNVRPLPEPIPCAGRQGWFGVSLPEGIAA